MQSLQKPHTPTKTMTTTRQTAPTNTSSTRKFLALTEIMGIQDALEWQNASGQEQVLQYKVLPGIITSSHWSGGHYDATSMLEQAGAKFHGPVKDDSLFQYAELPEGWFKEAQENQYFVDILDKEGRRRGYIFYKAAIHDRNAALTLLQRFEIVKDYDADKEGLCAYRVVDRGEIVFNTTPFPYPKDACRFLTANGPCDECYAWLDARYPGYSDDTTKYWND